MFHTADYVQTFMYAILTQAKLIQFLYVRNIWRIS